MANIEIEAQGKTDVSITVYAFATAVCDKWQYSLNDGEWITFSEEELSNAVAIIDGLKPNTEYKVEVRAKRKNLLIYYTSTARYVKTKYASSITSVEDVYIDDSNSMLVVKASVPSSGYNHKLIFRKQREELFSIETELQDGNNTFALTDEQRKIMLKSIPDVKSVVITADLYTYKNTTQMAYSFCTFHARTSVENSAPIFENFTYEDINEKTTSLTQDNQILISTVSQLRVNIEKATARNYSTIVAYTVAVGSINVTSAETTVDIGVVSLANSVPIVVTAIDSRGYTTILTKVVNFIPYTNVEITNAEISRINDVSETAKITIEGNFSPIIINGVDLNYIKYIHYSTKKTSDTEYENYKVIIPDFVQENNSFSYTNNEWITFNENNSYNVLVRVVDALSNNDDYSTIIPPSKPLLSLRKGKVGVNNKNPQYAVDVDGDINLTGKIYINGEEL